MSAIEYGRYHDEQPAAWHGAERGDRSGHGHMNERGRQDATMASVACRRVTGVQVETGRFGPGVCLESTNLYKFPRMEERTTAGDEAGCRVVRRGGSQRARLGSRDSRPNRSGCRSRGRAGGSLGAIGRGRRFDPTTKSKAMSSLPTSSKRATGRLGESRLKGGSRVLSEEGQTREGNESVRRTKAARKWHSGDPGRVVPRSPLVQVPSALVLGLAGGAGVRCVARN